MYQRISVRTRINEIRLRESHGIANTPFKLPEHLFVLICLSNMCNFHVPKILLMKGVPLLLTFSSSWDFKHFYNFKGAFVFCQNQYIVLSQQNGTSTIQCSFLFCRLLHFLIFQIRKVSKGVERLPHRTMLICPILSDRPEVFVSEEERIGRHRDRSPSHKCSTIS